MTRAITVPTIKAAKPAGKLNGNLNCPTKPQMIIIREAKPTTGLSRILAKETLPINTKAIPQSVPSMPARGVTRFKNGPAMAPNAATIPPIKPAAIPTCQASSAS